MVIDFHTHSFPPDIAKKALAKLSAGAHIMPYTDGTLTGLVSSMKQAGIDYSVLLPVVTNPSHQETVNLYAIECCESAHKTGVFSFGGIHPENDNYKEILRFLAEHGVKGIKLHPVFQGVDIDDIRYQRIVSYANECGLFVLTHAGYDIGFPGWEQSSPAKILRLIQAVQPDKLILAHMGGWGSHKEVQEFLLGQPIYLDTSFSTADLYTAEGTLNQECTSQQLSMERFCSMVRAHGADRILFGSDSPWASQKDAVLDLQHANLTDEEKEKILGGNAAVLLGL